MFVSGFYLNGLAQQTVSVDIFRELIGKQKSVQLLDVRTPQEFAGGHLSNATNADVRSDAFVGQTDKLKKDEPVFVYCLSGGRSAGAAKKLAGLGFKEVYDMKGGIMAWKNAGLPIEAATNAPDRKGMSKADYDHAISSDIPVLVDFYAPWCAPCKKMSPMLDEMTSTYGNDFKLLKLNADENDILMKELSITQIPTFLIYKNGKMTWKHVGATEKETLVTELGLK